MNLFKPIWIVLGTLSLCLGVIGIMVPGLPTTPFLLLTAGLYLKSSDRLYGRLISNRWVGPYIVAYHANKGMTFKSKCYAVALMWLTILLSVIFGIDVVWAKGVVLALGVAGSVVVGLAVPTVFPSDREEL